jgi:hypothetical protein
MVREIHAREGHAASEAPQKREKGCTLHEGVPGCERGADTRSTSARHPRRAPRTSHRAASIRWRSAASAVTCRHDIAPVRRGDVNERRLTTQVLRDRLRAGTRRASLRCLESGLRGISP